MYMRMHNLVADILRCKICLFVTMDYTSAN